MDIIIHKFEHTHKLWRILSTFQVMWNNDIKWWYESFNTQIKATKLIRHGRHLVLYHSLEVCEGRYTNFE